MGSRWSIKASVKSTLNAPQFIVWHSSATSCHTKSSYRKLQVHNVWKLMEMPMLKREIAKSLST